MTADPATDLVQEHDATTLAYAAASHVAASLIRNTDPENFDEALAIELAAFELIVLQLVRNVAPEQLGPAALARLRAADGCTDA